MPLPSLTGINRSPVQTDCYCLSAMVAFLLLSPFAEASRPVSSGDVWVATIAVDSYPKLPPQQQLRFCKNDEEMLVSRLREGNRMPLDRLCRFSTGGVLPTKENIESQLPEFLAQARTEDVVILFVSLHGTRIKSANGQYSTHLMPQNADPEQIAETTIPLSWLRDLLCKQVKARRVMVIMDACHSGGIRPSQNDGNVPMLSATTRDIRVTFEQTQTESSNRSIYVLTSCDTDEVSLETPDTQHGLFTHWLICGMDGAADRNEDAVVSMDELFGFTCEMVPRSAEYYSQASKKPVTQRPQRILLGASHEDIPLLALTPKSPEAVFSRLAVGIDSTVRHSLVRIQDRPARQPLIMLAELSPERTGDTAFPEFGAFPLICRQKIEDHLLEQVNRLPLQYSYGVADARAMMLQHRDIALIDLQEGRVQNGALDAVVFGTFRREGQPGSVTDPDRLCITIRVRHTGSGALIGLLRNSILIDRDFVTMFGGSSDEKLPAIVPQSPAQLPERQEIVLTALPMLAVEASPESLQEQVAIHQASNTEHPLLNPAASTLKVQVMQGTPGEALTEARWNPVDPENPNLLSFTTCKGNRIAMDLTNQTDEPVAVVVQIDGINQIGRNVADPSKSCYWSVQPRGRFVVDQWMDRPDIKPLAAAFTVAGGQLVVSAPPESVAGRQKVTDQLGEIRIVVYGMKVVKDRDSRSISESRLGISESDARISKTYPVDRTRMIDLKQHKATYVIRYYHDVAARKMASN
jgi:hypothetical protein